MQSIREAIHNLEQSNERQFGQTAAMSNCERCLKGRRGKVDGTFVWKEEDADSVQVIYVCPNRHDCEKLLQYKDGLIDRLKEKSGMSPDLLRKTVSGFMAEEPYQKVLRSVTANYVMNAFSKFESFDTPPWLFLGGQSGSGKTHLCAAASNAFIEKGRRVKYCAYTDLTRALSMFDYDLEDEIKHAKILFLDDLFKIEPNAGELKSLFDIIDFRYRHNLQTIISSEKRLSEIEQIDEAIAGRILERCGSFVAGVSQADGRNYRKEKYAAD